MDSVKHVKSKHVEKRVKYVKWQVGGRNCEVSFVIVVYDYDMDSVNSVKVMFYAKKRSKIEIVSLRSYVIATKKDTSN